MQKNKEQAKLARYIKERSLLEWDEYMVRFKGTKPLELWRTKHCPLNLDIKKISESVETLGIICSKYRLKPVGPDIKLVGGLLRKMEKEELEKLNYLETDAVGWEKIFHRRVIEILQKLCPEDFEAVPVTIRSVHKDIAPYETNEFYMLNVLKCIDAVDMTKSVIKPLYSKISGKIFDYHITELYYKEDPWQDGYDAITRNKDPNYSEEDSVIYYKMDKPCRLAIDGLSGAIVWHPSVAKELPISSMWRFIMDYEQNFRL